MWSFSLFCFVVAVAVVPLGHALGFMAALVLQLVAHGLVLQWMRFTRAAG